ncbi:GTP-binding protein [Faecalibaculum rodentium]|uniref:GTP-binding protein n=1 Tax=Faecalibaculum rodentium TaxID=1702221 RepID=UPI0025AA1D95|nr:GTP-binding protein [Faecalibaculum rodentium]
MKHIVLSILAHVDAGKTTLIESLLYTAGTIRRPGRVDKQTTVLDDDIQERERGITIYAKEAGFAWKDTGVQVIDTPGHADFSSEMERGLSAADLAVVIVSGLDGVQSHTKTIWRLLEAAGIPALVFVNKMDLARRSEEDLLADIQTQLSAAAVPLDPEQIALTDDALLEEWDQTGEISRDHIRTRVAARKPFRCFSGAPCIMRGPQSCSMP